MAATQLRTASLKRKRCALCLCSLNLTAASYDLHTLSHRVLQPGHMVGSTSGRESNSCVRTLAMSSLEASSCHFSTVHPIRMPSPSYLGRAKSESATCYLPLQCTADAFKSHIHIRNRKGSTCRIQLQATCRGITLCDSVFRTCLLV